MKKISEKIYESRIVGLLYPRLREPRDIVNTIYNQSFKFTFLITFFGGVIWYFFNFKSVFVYQGRGLYFLYVAGWLPFVLFIVNLRKLPKSFHRDLATFLTTMGFLILCRLWAFIEIKADEYLKLYSSVDLAALCVLAAMAYSNALIAITLARVYVTMSYIGSGDKK